MDLQLRTNEVVGIPQGDVVLFLAKALFGFETCFCAVFGPTKTCLPNNGGHAELSEATIAIFDEAGGLSTVYPVCHGHKYSHGGGMAEIDSSGTGVSWTTSDKCGRSMFFGSHIRPADVLVAL